MKRFLPIVALCLSCSGSGKTSTGGQIADTSDVQLADVLISGSDVDDEDDWGKGALPGNFGWPCSENKECLSGWCVESPKGDVCTQTCLDYCPPGWECKAVSNIGTDLVYVCVAPHARLCWPCRGDAECLNPTGDPGARCVANGDYGNFCGTPCGETVACPPGFKCSEATLATGGTAKQCVAEEGDCVCNGQAANLKLETDCAHTNDDGKCPGVRRCETADEIASYCDAAFPEVEMCDGVDNDCNGETDGKDAKDCVVWYPDNDGDGAGIGTGECLCDSPGPGFSQTGGDCNDLDKGVNPDAKEICNFEDDNCNDVIDDDGALGCAEWFPDLDLDGFGSAADMVCQCVAPGEDWISAGGDCDDKSNVIHPDATEMCDGLDNNCNGEIDEQNADGCTVYYPDADGDGFGQTEQIKCLCESNDDYKTDNGGDCDDTNPAVHPLAVETCNGLDDNCDGVADEDGTQGCSTFYKDADKDGYGDLDDVVCLCAPAAPYTATQAGDCDDLEKTAFPGGKEVCDAVDNDCNGEIDNGTGGCINHYMDMDKDGYGTGDPECLCWPEEPYLATLPGDCDDGNPNINPGAEETCEPGDQNCNGLVDEAGALGCATFFKDEDKDGWGVDQSQCLCVGTSPFSATKTGDCFDANAKARPGQTGWFGVDRGDGSFDYDCNGEAKQKDLASGACGTVLDCDTKKGWKNSTPACGQSSSWIYDCDWKWFKCHTESNSKQQLCH